MTIKWQPCEAHPRPEEGWGPHSDIILRGVFFFFFYCIDIIEYHNLMYKLTTVDNVDIESIESVAKYLAKLTDPEVFRNALESGAYIEELKVSDNHAYEESGVWIIPAFRMNGEKLDAKGGVGVTKEELKEFLKKSIKENGHGLSNK
jgi:predicted DsbA family dithiol-disulfide isomerase